MSVLSSTSLSSAKSNSSYGKLCFSYKMALFLMLVAITAFSTTGFALSSDVFVARAVIYPQYENMIGDTHFYAGCTNWFPWDAQYSSQYYFLAGGSIGTYPNVINDIYGLNKFTAGIPFSYPIGYAGFNFTTTSNSTCIGSTVRLDAVKSNFNNDSYLNGSALASYQTLGSFIVAGSSNDEWSLPMTNDSTMDGLYNNSGAWTMQAVKTIDSGCGGTGNCYNGIIINSHLNPDPASIVLNLYNGISNSGDATIGFLGNYYYDFESGKGDFSSFPLSEFNYYVGDHNIYPHVPMFHVGTIAHSLVDINPWEWCNGAAYSMSNAYVSANLNDGYDDLFCFNLTSQHGGKNFYGLLDVQNNTNSRFAYKAFIFGSNLTFFNNVQMSPINPTVQSNLTITVNFSYPLEGRLIWKKIIGGIPQAPDMSDDPIYDTFHSFVIPASNYSTNTTITWWIEGYDNSPAENYKLMQPSTTTIFLNVTPIYPFIPTVITPYNDVANKIGSGANFIIDTAPCPLCSPPDLHQSIAGWCSVDNMTEKSTHLYDITPLNSSSPHTAYVSTWTLAEINGTGMHNVSCRPGVTNQDLFQPNMTAMNVTGDPFYSLVFLPSIPSCDSLVLFNQSRCEQEMINRSAGVYAAWYCKERGLPSYPNIYCGLYEGFGCVNASLVPAGYAVNGSTANVNCITPPPGNFSQPPVNFTVPPFLNNNATSGFLYNFLGMTPYIFLNFLSLIIAIAITIVVAIFSRSGLATGIVFVGGIILFCVIGWLPIWVLIIIAVITAFLVGKFARETIFGGGNTG